jgi:hypothetical protein
MTGKGGPFPYGSAQAFRSALRDRLAASARAGGHGLDEMQRQFAYDRLLARAFSGPEADRWVLKGAGALLARLPDARHSRDIDLAYGVGGQQFVTTGPRADTERVDVAAEALRLVAERDIGDFFRFEITKSSPLQEAAKGRRLHLVAYLGARYAAFQVDIVVGTAMTAVPESSPPLTPVQIEGLVRPGYRLFPLVDHIADKLSAVVEKHDRRGATRPSTRIKDLVDLALIAGTQSVNGEALADAIRIGFAHRAMQPPARFEVPDVEAWRIGYPAKAAEAPGALPGFDDAVALVAAFLDPVLTGTVRGSWNPADQSWICP